MAPKVPKTVDAMLRHTADGAMVVAGGSIILWNQAAERLMGFKAAEVLGRPCRDVFRGLTWSGARLCSASCEVAARTRSGCPLAQFDMQTRTKSGRPLLINVTSLSLPAGRGRCIAVHLFRDCTRDARARRLVDQLRGCLEYRAEPLAVPAGVATRAPRCVQDRVSVLSRREREILDLLGTGLPAPAIADRLCISPATLRNHIQHILAKLGAHSRLQALALAYHPGP
ncbi:LuxR C-terminal-related transcriptional regulator [Candidatus Nitrospira bockiana]